MIYIIVLFSIPFLFYTMISEYLDTYRVESISSLEANMNSDISRNKIIDTENNKNNSNNSINIVDKELVNGNLYSLLNRVENIEKIEWNDGNEYTISLTNIVNNKIPITLKNIENLCMSNKINIKYSKISYRSDKVLEIKCKLD